MTTINITLHENEILRRLFTEGGYTAASRQAMGMPGKLCDTLAITNDDKRLVCDYIKTSINEVAAIVGRYHSHCLVENSINGNNNYYIIKFAAPANFPASCQLQMYEAAIDYIVSNTMQQISMLLKPDEANIHASRTQSHLARLRDILSQRSKPQKQQ